MGFLVGWIFDQASEPSRGVMQQLLMSSVNPTLAEDSWLTVTSHITRFQAKMTPSLPLNDIPSSLDLIGSEFWQLNHFFESFFLHQSLGHFWWLPDGWQTSLGLIIMGFLHFLGWCRKHLTIYWSDNLAIVLQSVSSLPRCSLLAHSSHRVSCGCLQFLGKVSQSSVGIIRQLWTVCQILSTSSWNRSWVSIRFM